MLRPACTEDLPAASPKRDDVHASSPVDHRRRCGCVVECWSGVRRATEWGHVMHKVVRGTEGDEALLSVAYGGRLGVEPLPKNRLPEQSTFADAAYRLVHDELLLDGSSRLNLATFVTTWMEPQAATLMGEAFDKNMIDKDEYPATAEIERRCVNIVADLFHAQPHESAVGVSTIGSSEAVMLAGLALKWGWRARRAAAGLPTDRPNLVLGTNVQVVWEKFCRYWDVEARYVPITAERFTITADSALAQVDENTIGVVAILGTTFTGEFEPIEEIANALERLNAAHGWDVPLHVDAASGGFVAPFLHPDLRWDFRLPVVKSINVSGHKYGLTYPGIGFALWRDQQDLPEDLVFHVNYLGGDMPTFTLNFSRPGNQIGGQYYNCVRLGREGYTRIMTTLREVAMTMSERVAKLGPFRLLSDGSDIPVFAFALHDSTRYSVFDVSNQLRRFGWQVPAYTMPANAEDVAVLRVVIREGFSADLGDLFMQHLRDSVHALEHGNGDEPEPTAFSHT
jgi:glutamate decarboxylase